MKNKQLAGSKQVRVSELVFAHIEKHANPLKDTVDSVLRRLLKLPAKVGVKRETGKSRPKKTNRAA
jgi:negative regulator of replication initiation